MRLIPLISTLAVGAVLAAPAAAPATVTGPDARFFAVSPWKVLPDKTAEIHFRINDSVPTANVKVAFVHIGTPPATRMLDLGVQPTGRMVHLKWTPSDRAGLIHGTYLATMLVTDSLMRSPSVAPVAWVKLRGS